jgi:hypothetical protein
MNEIYRYDATLERKKIQILPKKLVLTTEVSLQGQEQPYTKDKKRFNLRATLWIPNVPYSRIIPKIGLTLSAGGKWLRLMFNTPNDAKLLFDALKRFTQQNSRTLARVLKEARIEQEKAWGIMKNENLNTTILCSTTIQGAKYKKTAKKRLNKNENNVSTQTGRIGLCQRDDNLSAPSALRGRNI